MRGVVSSVFIFFAVSLFAGDAWNQPQLDKADAFHKQFGGPDRSSDENLVTVKSSPSGTSYVIVGVVVVLIASAIGVAISRNRKITKQKPRDDDE